MGVIVVANPKGGVGKSTLTTRIAGCPASRGHAVKPTCDFVQDLPQRPHGGGAGGPAGARERAVSRPPALV